MTSYSPEKLAEMGCIGARFDELVKEMDCLLGEGQQREVDSECGRHWFVNYMAALDVARSRPRSPPWLRDESFVMDLILGQVKK
jgi:hypothetical protein